MPPTVFPKGVTINLPDKAYACYVVFDGRDGCSYVIDMNGNDVRTWPHSGFPSEIIDPAVNGGRKGHVFLQKNHDEFNNESLLEMDWDANIVWQWGEAAPGGKAHQAWDQARLPTGNTLVFSIADHEESSRAEWKFADQAIYEVTSAGDIHWTWRSCDHLAQFGFTGEKLDLLVAQNSRPRPTVLILNNMSPLGPNKLFDGGDDRFHPENIMTDSRVGNFIAIIEKSTGDIAWQVGPDYEGAYDLSRRSFSGELPRPIDSISGQHDAHLIPPGLPGEGNILLFDNQGAAGMPHVHLATWAGSRILEIDPLSKQILWQYDASVSNQPYWQFYSCFISSARRLPNGNTLICEGMHGRIFQVTREGEVVWEYVNPHFGIYGAHNSSTGHGSANWIYRAQPVPYDWVPDGTPRSEKPVIPPDHADYRVPTN